MPHFRLDTSLSGGGEPLRMAHYEVQINGIQGLSLACQTVALPNGTIAPVEIHNFNDKIKIAGEVDWASVSLEIRDTIDPDHANQINDWFTQVYDFDTGNIGFAADYKRQGTITQYTSKGTRHRGWRIVGVWPTNFTPGSLDSSSREPVMISLELSIDRALMIS